MGLLEEAVRAYTNALELDQGNTAVQREMEAVGKLVRNTFVPQARHEQQQGHNQRQAQVEAPPVDALFWKGHLYFDQAMQCYADPKTRGAALQLLGDHLRDGHELWF